MPGDYDLLTDVLKSLSKANVMEEIILIGGWCLPIYHSLFENSPMIPVLRTADIDFMVPNPPRVKIHADIPAILKSLEFIETVDEMDEVTKFIHRDLEIEFLIPEIGVPQNHNPYIPELKIRPQRLRYLNLLQDNIMISSFCGIDLRVPEPAAFVIQKFLCCDANRRKPEKQAKDLYVANEIGLFLLSREEQITKLIRVFHSMNKGWQRKFLKITKSQALVLYEKFMKKIVRG